ncbi:MAG: hypothetical protein ACTHPS_15490 [Streptosporangiaceae bacterium]
MQLKQRGTLGLGQDSDLLLAGLDLAVDACQLGDQLGYEPPAGLAGDVAGPGGRDQGTGLGRGQELLRPSREQFQQQPVDPAAGLSAGPAQLVAPVSQQAQHDQIRADLDPDQAR